MTIAPTLLRPGEGKPIWQLGNHFTLKAGADETRGAFAVLEQVCTGAPPPMHVHEREEETFYVLSGSINLYVGDEVHAAEAGSFCVVPRGLPHSFTSTSDEPARMLVIVSPPGFEEFFVEVEEQFPEAAGLPAPERVGPVLGELARRHGLQIVGPPPG